MAITPRHQRALAPVRLGARHVKRYHLSLDSDGIEPAVIRAADQFLPELLPAPDGTPPASFVVLHRGQDGSYLNAYSWVWEHVVECQVAVAGLPFLGCPDGDPAAFVRLTRPWIGCVWELPTVAHERAAWVRHVLAPAEPDLDAYLADHLPDGPTG